MPGTLNIATLERRPPAQLLRSAAVPGRRSPGESHDPDPHRKGYSHCRAPTPPTLECGNSSPPSAGRLASQLGCVQRPNPNIHPPNPMNPQEQPRNHRWANVDADSNKVREPRLVTPGACCPSLFPSVLIVHPWFKSLILSLCNLLSFRVFRGLFFVPNRLQPKRFLKLFLLREQIYGLMPLVSQAMCFGCVALRLEKARKTPANRGFCVRRVVQKRNRNFFSQIGMFGGVSESSSTDRRSAESSAFQRSASFSSSLPFHFFGQLRQKKHIIL